MNQVNPLHIGALLLTVLLFLFFKLDALKAELGDAKTELSNTKQVARQLVALQDMYGDQKKCSAALDRILHQPSLKSADLTKALSKDSIKITAKSINADALNSLMGKILNGNYNITKFDLKKIDENQASLEMEIKW